MEQLGLSLFLRQGHCLARNLGTINEPLFDLIQPYNNKIFAYYKGVVKTKIHKKDDATK